MRMLAVRDGNRRAPPRRAAGADGGCRGGGRRPGGAFGMERRDDVGHVGEATLEAPHAIADGIEHHAAVA